MIIWSFIGWFHWVYFPSQCSWHIKKSPYHTGILILKLMCLWHLRRTSSCLQWASTCYLGPNYSNIIWILSLVCKYFFPLNYDINASMSWYDFTCLVYISSLPDLIYTSNVGVLFFLNEHGHMPLIFRDKRHVLCTKRFVSACLIRLLSLRHALFTRHAIYQLTRLSGSDEIYVHHYLLL